MPCIGHFCYKAQKSWNELFGKRSSNFLASPTIYLFYKIWLKSTKSKWKTNDMHSL